MTERRARDARSQTRSGLTGFSEEPIGPAERVAGGSSHTAHVESLEQAIRRREDRLLAAERTQRKLQEELDAIHGSTSWRLTAPLRWFRSRHARAALLLKRSLRAVYRTVALRARARVRAQRVEVATAEHATFDPAWPAEAPRLLMRGTSRAYMTPADADLLEVILLRVGERRSSLRVLEWGCGLSTLHYPRWLERRGIDVSWLSIEHDRDFFHEMLEPMLRESGAQVAWSENICDTAGTSPPAVDGLTVVVFDEGSLEPFDRSPTRYVDRAKSLDEYVSIPARLGGSFDVVLVDGRKRRRCLLESTRLVDPAGIVLLHDAQRPYYHCGFSAFTSGRRIGDELWIGAREPTDFTDVVPASGLAAAGFEYIPGA